MEFNLTSVMQVVMCLTGSQSQCMRCHYVVIDRMLQEGHRKGYLVTSQRSFVGLTMWCSALSCHLQCWQSHIGCQLEFWAIPLILSASVPGKVVGDNLSTRASACRPGLHFRLPDSAWPNTSHCGYLAVNQHMEKSHCVRAEDQWEESSFR